MNRKLLIALSVLALAAGIAACFLKRKIGKDIFDTSGAWGM